MSISLIAAMAENRVIGKNNAIPWDLPADRKRFKDLTMGHGIIMGRKTFESIGRPLPGRINIIVTRQTSYKAQGCLVAHDLGEALRLASLQEDVFICGGGDIYRQALPLANRIFLTIVHRKYQGDTFFPEIPMSFREVESQFFDGDPPYTFMQLAT